MEINVSRKEYQTMLHALYHKLDAQATKQIKTGIPVNTRAERAAADSMERYSNLAEQPKRTLIRMSLTENELKTIHSALKDHKAELKNDLRFFNDVNATAKAKEWRRKLNNDNGVLWMLEYKAPLLKPVKQPINRYKLPSQSMLNRGIK